MDHTCRILHRTGVWCAFLGVALGLSSPPAALAGHAAPDATPQEQTQTAEERLQAAVVGLYQRLFAQTDPSRRHELVLEMIDADLPGVSALAFRLAHADAVSGRTPHPDVLERASRSLQDEEVAVRRGAAQIMMVSPSPALSRAAIGAIEHETDVVTLARLLRVASRFPAAGDDATGARLLLTSDDPALHAAAIDLIAAVPVGDRVVDGASVVARVIELDDQSLPQSIVGLLGSYDRHDLIASRLLTADARLSTEAAAWLAADGLLIGEVVRAAEERPYLFTSACVGLATIPSRAAFELAARLPAPDDETKRGGLNLVFRALSDADALAVSEAHPDSTRRAELLAFRLGDVRLESGDWSAAAADSPTPQLLGIRLMDALIKAGRPADAARYIAGTPPADGPLEHCALAVRVLAASGSFEQAAMLIAEQDDPTRRDALMAAYGSVVDGLGERAEAARESLITVLQRIADEPEPPSLTRPSEPTEDPA